MTVTVPLSPVGKPQSTSGPLCLYLIRHGETAWTLSRQHTGSTDLPLTAHGEEEARKLCGRLSEIAFTHVLSSPLQRARQTCVLAGLGREPEIEPDLAEWDYGDYEGKRSAGIRESRPGWNVFQDGCPGGETPAQVSDRADRLIRRLREMDGNVALFGHGQFGAALAVRWIGLPMVNGQHFSLSEASLSILRDDLHHPKVPVIALWNDAGRDA